MSIATTAIPMNIAAARVACAGRRARMVSMVATELVDDAPSATRQPGRRRF